MARRAWPDGPRYTVNELEGYGITVAAPKRPTSDAPGLTVWVADEAYNGREVKVWRTSDRTRVGLAAQKTAMRNAARMLSRSRNQAEQYAARRASDDGPRPAA